MIDLVMMIVMIIGTIRVVVGKVDKLSKADLIVSILFHHLLSMDFFYQLLY